jgi:adenylate cyclase
MIRSLKGLFFGLLVGLLGIFAMLNPYGMAIEEDFGLALLFKLRGDRTPPQKIVIVALDKQSSDRLSLPRDTRKWPRDYHARLVKKLKKAGAGVIAFDIFFKEPRENDRLFVASIEKAGNVVLIQSIEKEMISKKKPDHSGGRWVHPGARCLPCPGTCTGGCGTGSPSLT